MLLHQLLYPNTSLHLLKIGEQCNASRGVALFIDGFFFFFNRRKASRWVFSSSKFLRLSLCVVGG
jgi:hypothetical protein